MKLVIEDYKNAKALLVGLFQFDKKEQFSQAVLGLTENELIVYDDNAPDSKEGDSYKYNVKKRVALSDIAFALNEKIIKNKDLMNLGRLTFVMHEVDNDVEFYYFVNDKKQLLEFIKELKSAHIKTKKRKVDLSLIKY